VRFEKVLAKDRLLIIAKRELVKQSNRYIIYLPVDLNDVWEEIKRNNKKVRVYIEVVN